MEYYITAGLIVIEIISFYNLNSIFLEKKNIKNLKCTMLAIIILQVIVSNIIVSCSTIIRMSINILLLFLISSIVFTGKKTQKLLISTIYLVMVYAMDYIAVFCVMLIFSVNSNDLIYNQVIFITISFLSKFIIYLLIFILKKIINISKDKQNYTAAQWAEIFLFSVCSLLSLYLIMDNAFNSSAANIGLVICSVAIIACNIMLFSILGKIEEENDLKQRNELLKQQIKLEMESIASLTSAYAKQRSLTHDFNNHISALQTLIKSNSSEAQKYIDKIAEKSDKEIIVINSNNPIVDAVITQKYLTAKDNNIEVQVIVGDLSNIPMEKEDLVVVLANLLDNAIEAARQCIDNRIIKVKIIQDNRDFILSIHNTAKQVPIVINNKIITTKDDKLNHGYGIKNIETVLQKYGYDYSISTEKGWFKVTVLMQG